MQGARVGRLCFVGAALLLGVMTLFVPVGVSGRTTSYPAVSPLAHASFLIAGLGLVVAGAVVAADATTGALGPLGVGAGVAWLMPAWIGWEHGPALVRSVAMVLAPFLAPVLLHLAFAAPSGRLIGRTSRAAVTVAYPVTAVASIGLAVTRDPFVDPNCWSNCTVNVFVVLSEPSAARWLGGGWLWAVLIGAALAAMVAVRK